MSLPLGFSQLNGNDLFLLGGYACEWLSVEKSVSQQRGYVVIGVMENWRESKNTGGVWREFKMYYFKGLQVKTAKLFMRKF